MILTYTPVKSCMFVMLSFHTQTYEKPGNIPEKLPWDNDPIDLIDFSDVAPCVWMVRAPVFSQTALSGAGVMKQTHLSVGSSRPQLPGELLLLFVLTTCNETSAPPHHYSPFRCVIIFTLWASSRLRLAPQISAFWSPAGCHSFVSSSVQLRRVQFFSLGPQEWWVCV